MFGEGKKIRCQEISKPLHFNFLIWIYQSIQYFNLKKNFFLGSFKEDGKSWKPSYTLKIFLTFYTSFLENNEREDALMLFEVKVKNIWQVFPKETLSPLK